jgi:hypothetical protein
MAQINIFITTKKGFFFLVLILVQVLSVQVLSLKHGKSLFRWEVQVHPHTFPLLTKKNGKKKFGVANFY